MQEIQETRVGSCGQEDPLEEEMATHSSILAWTIPRTEDPGRLQSMGSQRDTTETKHNYIFIITQIWKQPNVLQWLNWINCGTSLWEMLLSNCKEGSLDMQGYDGLQCIMLKNKGRLKSYLFYDSIYKMFWKRQNCNSTEKTRGFSGIRGKRKTIQRNSSRQFWGCNEIILYLEFCISQN